MTILLLAALIPPIYLMWRIYQMDKVEREPPGLVFRVFLAGAVSVIPALFLESYGGQILGQALPSDSPYYLPIFFLIVVAWSEEGVKHFALKHTTWNNPNFNYRFDAIVYSTAAALGFAAAENIEYVFAYGLSVALTRAVTAIPGHCIFGLFMGYYYGTAKYFRQKGNAGRARRYQILSILIPVLMHGFYDYTATSSSSTGTMLFLVYIIIMDIIAIASIRKFAREDEALENTYDIYHLEQ